MNDIVAWVLGIATFLGGIAAILYFLEKWRESQKWHEEDKEVNNAWWDASELKKQYEEKGYKDFAWSNSDRVAARMRDGMSIVYDVDEKNKTKYRFVNRSGQVLLCRNGV